MRLNRSALTRGIGLTGLMAMLASCADEEAVVQAPVAAETIVMNGERLFPESITSDAVGNIYIGSNPGVIFRATVGDETAEPWITPDDENGLVTVFGVLADDQSGLLWVCSNDMSGASGPAIKTFALADGSFQSSYPFPADAGPTMCNDMTVANDGDVYASEMAGARIMRLPAGTSEWEVFAADPEFASVDGIALAEDGTLYANAIQRNSLLRVNVDEDGAFRDVTVLTPSREMGGPDGLRLLEGHRFLQSEGNSGLITVVSIEGDQAEIEVIAEGIDYASSVTAVNGRAYYPEGKLGFLFGPNAGEDPGEFIIRSVPVPEVK